MTGFVSETSIAEIAQFLKDKKSRGDSVGLLLGHRAGPLFNDSLYAVLKRHAMTVGGLPILLRQGTSTADDLTRIAQYIQLLDNLSVSDRFRECYNQLALHFSENGVHNILFSVLVPPRYREEDELMAGLIKTGFFDTIFTTNIDNLLEDACALLGMRKGIDYQVIMSGTDDSTILGQGSNISGQMVKVFGDFVSSRYKTAGTEFDLEADQRLKKFLVTELSKDVIILGYDPIWDRPIERAFQETGGTLWYVDEEEPEKHTHLAHILNQRNGKYISGPQGRYLSFLRALNNIIGERAITGSSLPLAQSQNPTRTKAFIGYSRKDKVHLERLQTHLKGYLHAASENDSLDMRVVIWDDTKIAFGADWDKEIKDALVHAKVAALLVSADFLASDYIRECELPILLEAERVGEVKILSLVLGPCSFRYSALARYLVMNNAEPLMGMKPYKQEAVWAKFAEQIYKFLKDAK